MTKTFKFADAVWMSEEAVRLDQARKDAEGSYQEVAEKDICKFIANLVQSLVPDAKSVSCEYVFENDDEGGIDPWLSYVSVYDSNGDQIDIESIPVMVTKKYSNAPYKDEAGGVIREYLRDYIKYTICDIFGIGNDFIINFDAMEAE